MCLFLMRVHIRSPNERFNTKRAFIHFGSSMCSNMILQIDMCNNCNYFVNWFNSNRKNTFKATAALNVFGHKWHLWLWATWTLRMWQICVDKLKKNWIRMWCVCYKNINVAIMVINTNAGSFGAILSHKVHFTGWPRCTESTCFFNRYLLVNGASQMLQFNWSAGFWKQFQFKYNSLPKIMV